MLKKILYFLGYVKKEQIQVERELLLLASKELHITYAKIIEEMAIKDFGVSPNVNIEVEEKWFNDNIIKAEYQIKNNKLNNGRLSLE